MVLLQKRVFESMCVCGGVCACVSIGEGGGSKEIYFVLRYLRMIGKAPSKNGVGISV